MQLSRSFPAGLLVIFITVSCSGPPALPTPTPEWELEGWELVWHDEFEGDALDPASWTFDLGAGGWGNNERQHYTDRPENLRIEDGVLVIEARQETYRAGDYTSARIKTQGLGAWRYGRIEARIRVPTGQGIWSAFWMLGEDFPSAGWPRSGEIDIMENIGEPDRVYGTVHGPGYSGGGGVSAGYTYPGPPLHEGFHVYAVEWGPAEIQWYVDGVSFHRVSADSLPGDWVYDHPFFIILNLAVGGEWPGYPDDTTVFPQQMQVDYVRVYRDPDLDPGSFELPRLHVGEIRLIPEMIDDDGWGAATVAVVDGEGGPVSGVAVEGSWLGTVAGADTSAITGEDGLAGPFMGKQNPVSTEITFCVSDLNHPGFEYDKDANEMTCAFVNPEAER
ncbi:MAG TPA: glycoside hydrolase family 16 protein [Anaerolineales bacterium]|nr:glycoside hydrolase family 16 protein [Anaerolineales bacterium]